MVRYATGLDTLALCVTNGLLPRDVPKHYKKLTGGHH